MKPLFTGDVSFTDVTVPLAVGHGDRDSEIDDTLTCIVLSDFHYTLINRTPLIYDDNVCCLDDETLNIAISHVNETVPDLVFLLGDFVNLDHRSIYPLAEKLSTLQAKIGVFACLGNHDHKQPGARDIVIAELRKAGVIVLWNDIVPILDGRLAIVGIADIFSGEANVNVLKDVPEDIPRIVLAHSPDTMHFAHCMGHRVDLMLSGHTHGGQLALPLGAPSLPSLVRSMVGWLSAQARHAWVPQWVLSKAFAVSHWTLDRGLFCLTDAALKEMGVKDECQCAHMAASPQSCSVPMIEQHRPHVWRSPNPGKCEWSGERFLYVTAGIGSHPPGRSFCPPEVTTLRLVRPGGIGSVTSFHPQEEEEEEEEEEESGNVDAEIEFRNREQFKKENHGASRLKGD